jgi:hypothetical protein
VSQAVLLSDDKTSHLSHVILEALKKSVLARLTGDEGKVLREIKRVLAEELAQEGEIDRIVRSRLASYSRPILEGSAEWETLYRKAAEEETRKRKKTGGGP